MKKTVHFKNFQIALLLIATVITSLTSLAQSGNGGGNGSGSSAAAPELVFKNPALTSGTANKEGAIYRFSNVGAQNGQSVDAEIKLKKFSRNDIVMNNVDLASLGWDKAFQPQFGLPGLVQPNQNWYIDFEMTFYKAGTNQKQKMQKVDLTALDVDGDGLSISEYVTYSNPSSVSYSTVSYLNSNPAGAVGQLFTCSADNIASPLFGCTNCGGDGMTGSGNNTDECQNCDGSGLLHDQCDHAFQGVVGTSVSGPVENFMNIDTNSTQVMVTYQYLQVDKIRFRYGAKSGAVASNGAGIRLNSTWFRQFSLAPAVILPVRMTDFNAIYKGTDVTLNWTTDMEENFSHFVVQRSNDGKNYTDIATVFPAGGNGVRTQYAYKDRNVSSASGMNFYRVLCVDKTKESTFSAVRIVRLAKDNAASLALSTYPNPVKDQLRVTLPASFQGKKVTLELYNANGVILEAIQLGAASQTEVLNIGNQSNGFYLVKATCEDQVAQQRVIKN